MSGNQNRQSRRPARGWGEADNKQRNNKDISQVVVRATAENKAGGGTQVNGDVQEVRAGLRGSWVGVWPRKQLEPSSPPSWARV